MSSLKADANQACSIQACTLAEDQLHEAVDWQAVASCTFDTGVLIESEGKTTSSL